MRYFLLLLEQICYFSLTSEILLMLPSLQEKKKYEVRPPNNGSLKSQMPKQLWRREIKKQLFIIKVFRQQSLLVQGMYHLVQVSFVYWYHCYCHLDVFQHYPWIHSW